MKAIRLRDIKKEKKLPSYDPQGLTAEEFKSQVSTDQSLSFIEERNININYGYSAKSIEDVMSAYARSLSFERLVKAQKKLYYRESSQELVGILPLDALDTTKYGPSSIAVDSLQEMLAEIMQQSARRPISSFKVFIPVKMDNFWSLIEVKYMQNSAELATVDRTFYDPFNGLGVISENIDESIKNVFSPAGFSGLVFSDVRSDFSKKSPKALLSGPLTCLVMNEILNGREAQYSRTEVSDREDFAIRKSQLALLVKYGKVEEGLPVDALRLFEAQVEAVASENADVLAPQHRAYFPEYDGAKAATESPSQKTVRVTFTKIMAGEGAWSHGIGSESGKSYYTISAPKTNIRGQHFLDKDEHQVFQSIYGSQQDEIANRAEDIMRAILINLCYHENMKKHNSGQPLSREQMLAIIDFAKNTGGVMHKKTQTAKVSKRNSGELKNEESLTSLGISARLAKNFSGLFQVFCASCGIFMDQKFQGQRLTFLPQRVIDNIVSEERSFEDLAQGCAEKIKLRTLEVDYAINYENEPKRPSTKPSTPEQSPPSTPRASQKVASSASRDLSASRSSSR